MDTLQNSDFFFVCESFKIFFEKVLTVISDPKGIAIQEWLKYKDKLTAKDATPSSIYCYAHQLVVSDSQQEGGNLVKIKMQQSRRNSKKINSPRKITRRNSFGSESPLNKINEGILPQNEENLGHLQNHHHNNNQNFSLGHAGHHQQQGNTQTNINGGSFADQMNQYSPWGENERKKNPSPAKRITTNEIKFIKGLDEVSKISKETKVNEKFETSKKLLLDKKDSTSLDLINDRSFQTQTMLIDPKNKNKPQDRQIKRQDSKFIREFSIYKKNNPTAVQGNTAAPSQPTSQNNIDYLKGQIPSTQQIHTAGTTGILPSSNNNFLLGNFDFVKSKNTQDLQTGTGYGNFGTLGTTGGLTSTGANYLTSTQRHPTINYQANPPLYMPQGQHKSTNSAGTATLLGVNSNMDDKNKQGIDDIVSRILKEQKSKEDNMKKYEQDKMVQDILYKHKIQNQVPSYTSSTTTNSTPYTTTGGLALNTTPSYNYQTSLTSSNNTTPYMTQSPIKSGIPSLNSLPSTGNYSTNYGLTSTQSSQK